MSDQDEERRERDEERRCECGDYWRAAGTKAYRL